VKRLGILISGRGSNMEAIIRNAQQGAFDAEVAVVISNKPSARGLQIARALGVEAICIASKGLEREAHDRLIVAELRKRSVDIVCLAGYMRLLSSWFVGEYPQAILNIHPALLPAFPGLDSQIQALEYGVKITGCTVHFVDEHLDHGPIVVQAAVEVRDDDTDHTLTDRLLKEEHRIYSEAIRIVASGKYRIEGRRVIRG